MLKKLLKLYTTAMTGKVYSPVPHLFGPPGCGKSTVVQQAADLLGVTLHTINVSRISPLELEGVQMPTTDHSKLNLLTATFWTQLKDGDILLLDEFLRGFPEVYNGLLDIMTSRQVGGYRLPEVFMIAASNTTVAYDKALEDRLLHLPVADPRSSKREYKRLVRLFIEETGLNPAMESRYEMDQLMSEEVQPTYEVLDQLERRAGITAASTIKGSSLRNLIGQVKLREVRSTALHEVLNLNNLITASTGKDQYLILSNEYEAATYKDRLARLEGVQHKLSDIQRLNYMLNMQFVELHKMQEAEREIKEEPNEDYFD